MVLPDRLAILAVAVLLSVVGIPSYTLSPTIGNTEIWAETAHLSLENVEVRGILTNRVVTAYSSTVEECDDTPFITASGARVRSGIIACPREFPLGSKFVIDGKMYVCEDRLSNKYDHRFDIWKPSKEMALEYGKQVKDILLVD